MAILPDDLDATVSRLLATWHVPGISLAIISNDQVTTKGYGIAELPGTEFTPDTLAYAGSCTKAHVTALLAVLVESGRYKDVQGRPLAWETPISALIPDFVLQDAWAAANVTLEDASCHRTGLAKHNNAYLRYLRLNGYDQPRKIISLREIVTQLRHLPMGSSPRSTFCYSNLMFAALSHVIETVTGEWLGDVLRTWLWEPLGMRDTYLSLDQALSSSKHVARGYYWDSTAEKYTAFERMPTEEVSGSGAVITTANDMAKWLQFWLCEEKPLTETGHRTLLRPNIRVDDGLNTGPFDVPLMYAKGWQTSAYRGHRFWTHHGSMDAFGAQVTFLPDLGLGVAALGNTAFTTSAVTELLTWYLVDWRLKVPQVERFDWLSKWNGAVSQIGENVRRGRDILYRDLPAGPPTLSWGKYAGLYYNPGYQYLDLTAAEAGTKAQGQDVQLQATQPDNNFRIKMDFVHVAAEKWIMYVDLLDAPTLTMHDFGAVEFTVAHGEVDSMRIQWRARTTIEGWIEYKRQR